MQRRDRDEALGDSQVVVKMEKDFEIATDAAVGIKIDPAQVSLFDATTGERIRAA